MQAVVVDIPDAEEPKRHKLRVVARNLGGERVVLVEAAFLAERIEDVNALVTAHTFCHWSPGISFEIVEG
jgi:hypothetical protein